MECLCPLFLLFAMLVVGYQQLFGRFFNVVYGIEDEFEEDTVADDDDLDDDFFGLDEVDDYEPPSYEIWGTQEPVDVRALLDSSLPVDRFTTFHDVTMPPRDGAEPVRIDHVVVAATGVFCIRTFIKDGEVDPCGDDEEWLHNVAERIEYFPSPRREIRATARRLARALDLQPRQVVGIVASAGKADLESDSPPGVYYAKDLPVTLERRTTERLTPEEIAAVRARLARGL